MGEYKPTEYVVDFGDYRSNAFVRLSMALIEQNGAQLGERIVRCKDCRHYMDYEHEFEPNLGYCREHDREEVRDSCFCACGERRE